MTFIDSNVLIDVVSRDPAWREWSVAQIEAAKASGPLLINAVVFAELSFRYQSVADVEEFVDSIGLDLMEPPLEALFLASKSFLGYRRNGGTRTGVLPDFFIGAHAVTLGVPLLTRDVQRYRTSFPELRLIAPLVN